MEHQRPATASADRRAHVRQRDRAMDDDAWIRAGLRAAPFAAVATVVDGQPFVNTNTFVFDEARRAIYFHTASRGRTRSNVEPASRVCFSVSEMGRLITADRAFSMSIEYAGVTVFGTAYIVTDRDEEEAAMRLLLGKYFGHLDYGIDYAAITDEEFARSSVYRIDIEAWSGKRKFIPDDTPGAFAPPRERWWT